MKHKWLLACTMMVIFVLSGCGKTVEEQIDSGIANAENVFKADAEETNKTIGEIKLYVPTRYNVKQSDDLNDSNNLILTKGKDQYLLFVNEHEKADSKLHYELLKKDQTKKIIKEEIIEEDEAFGFTAIVEADEEHYELIVSSGGAKISTITEQKKIDTKLEDMMAIVRSVQLKE
ncbi:hypothetical protein [Lysinibacillus antri]|uniref:Uncharacterized protein n=1 Tax=Lysinibacillus antri TaxID=2498145 RepID=A0A432LFZ8_9BACI|nr:hypothetical protein [Lysinibacillus antri]RUL56518.1 hypothetical protein EK386_02505 [Lysinibacillus antri]